MQVDTLIVGAGFSGLCMAIHLRRDKMDSFLIVEKGTDIGGTWHENRYPGCACDIPSHLYCFSFDKNSQWSRMYAGQKEIKAYLKSCVERFQLSPNIRLNTALREAVWNQATGRWQVTLSDGGTVDARVLVSGVGALHVPAYPELSGADQFAGTAFHSAEWNEDIDLEGKTIAVIGTGASAIQFVPRIATLAKKLYVFQRTPAWIVPKPDPLIADSWQNRFRQIPGAMRLFRTFLFIQHEIRVLGFLGNKKLQTAGEQMAREHLSAQVSNETLRAKLTPKYAFGCKRVLGSSDFYPAMMRPNVELVTNAIQEVKEHSIIDAEGIERPVDVIIYGTGFRVTDFFRGLRIVGRDGLEIHEAWRKEVGTYLGITVSGFPNFYMLLGPNTGLGHNSVVLMIEAGTRYIMNCLRLMKRRNLVTLEVKPDVQKRFLEQLRQRLKGTVWQTGGCRSWYQDQATGENPVLWPGSVISYIRRTRHASLNDYTLTAPASAMKKNS